MKTIHIDCNSTHGENSEICISEATVRYFNLKDGMAVNVCEGNEVWDAVVHRFISSDECELWYVELGNLKEVLDAGQCEWNSIGFHNGLCLGKELEKSMIVQRMLTLGYPPDEIDKIVCMNHELKRKVEKLFKNH